MPLKVDQPAPDFTLPSTRGTSFTLSRDLPGKPVILYFYPKDFTSVCTKEACEFRDSFSLLRELQTEVIGISRDSVETHVRFQQEHKLPFDLLADVNGEVAERYGAVIPLIRVTRRITYLLDSNHRIAAVYENMFAAEKHIHAMVTQVQQGMKQ